MGFVWFYRYGVTSYSCAHLLESDCTIIPGKCFMVQKKYLMGEMRCSDILSIVATIIASTNTEGYELVIDISTGKY